MDSAELKEMRRKQVALTNGIIITELTLFFVIISVFDVTFSVFLFIMGVFILIQAVLGLLKGDSTKSFISTFEQVANYEKQKMGREGNKQRKVSYIWQLIFSGFMFWQYFMNRGSADYVIQLDFIFIFIIALIIVGVINVTLLMHFKKVDNSNTVSDFKGYTWKSSIIAVVAGVVMALVSIVFILIYILSTI